MWPQVAAMLFVLWLLVFMVLLATGVETAFTLEIAGVRSQLLPVWRVVLLVCAV